ncbi:Cwf19-like protein [Theobroma cacao]|uniref:CwfJ-like family protein, putative n=1 Tax=Theobroma cacao TaxID=3641 RepID=S1SM94_THECC|nr:CwfJ-like family protein, putative [Theobroma cacao]WRX16768.1 Cwf19-like protein [Theobroma cacao]
MMCLNLKYNPFCLHNMNQPQEQLTIACGMKFITSKECLVVIFAKDDKKLVFLDMLMAWVQQHRHCLIDCIPMPQEIVKQALVYFKKARFVIFILSIDIFVNAIDGAEDEWSEHNAKKLIDTSDKGLYGSILKKFPYLHVEFGLNKGFVHVIDDESQFKSNLGLNVIRGMLQLPEEDMYCHRRHQSVKEQKQYFTSFAHDWELFDWRRQLH